MKGRISAYRTHDTLYLHEDRSNNTKESFKFINSIFVKENVKSICDVGCATGEFLYYFKQQHPEITATGIDVMPELLERAKCLCPDVTFYEGNIAKKNTLPQVKFDAVFCLGVLGIFDNPQEVLTNLVSLLKKNVGCKLYLFTSFNDYPVDVLLRVRRTDGGEPSDWEVGWNLFSYTTIKNTLMQLGARTVEKFPFHISIDLPPHPEDPLRSWTEKTPGGERYFISGMRMIQDQQVIVATF